MIVNSGCVHTHITAYLIFSAHTYPQVMVCLQVLLVSHHHLIISHPLLLLLSTHNSSYQQAEVCVYNVLVTVSSLFARVFVKWLVSLIIVKLLNYQNIMRLVLVMEWYTKVMLVTL